MRQPNIKVKNLNKIHKVNEVFIKNIIRKILAFLKKPQDTKLEVIFLSDNLMRPLNKRYKKRDRSTDVLSFKIGLEEFKSKSFLGEIFISLDTAFRNAKIFKSSFAHELVLYIIHAILHLFGYDDKRRKDRLRMVRKENDILNRLCKKENLSKVLMPR